MWRNRIKLLQMLQLKELWCRNYLNLTQSRKSNHRLYNINDFRHTAQTNSHIFIKTNLKINCSNRFQFQGHIKSKLRGSRSIPRIWVKQFQPDLYMKTCNKRKGLAYIKRISKQWLYLIKLEIRIHNQARLLVIHLEMNLYVFKEYYQTIFKIRSMMKYGKNEKQEFQP